jgi:hypothetical protein
MKALPPLLLAALALVLVRTPATAADVRDPMRPPAPAAAAHTAPAEADPAVTAIFYAGEHRAAILGGRLVHAGDTVGRCVIEAVLEDGVRCRGSAIPRELHLPLAGIQVKTPAATSARVANGVF